jgi:hypothetical protein
LGTGGLGRPFAVLGQRMLQHERKRTRPAANNHPETMSTSAAGD